MIRGFKPYVDGEWVCCVLLEYGPSANGLSADLVAQSLSGSGIKEIDRDAIEQGINGGKYGTIDVSRAIPENFDAVCWVTGEPGGKAAIHIAPQVGKGRTLESIDITIELRDSGYGDLYVHNESIERQLTALKESPKQVQFLAAEPRDGEASVEVSPDHKAAFLTYKAPMGGEPISKADILSKLSSAKVIACIDENAIEKIIADKQDVFKYKIAAAKEAVDGVDATIKYLFDAYHLNIGPRIDEDDRADFRDLGIFENVEAGTAVAKKEPVTPGQEGMDVTGKVLKAKTGRDVALPKGKNVKISEKDPNVLESIISGAPKLVGNKVTVEDVLMVGDVDFSTGNIDFVGNVLVKGVVNSGFSITAEGDITCNDIVEGANLKAGGNILFKRGIKGQSKSHIEAGGDIIAKFIENSTVVSFSSIFVDEALIHSHSSAVNNIEVMGTKGSIFGGQASAGKLIKANYIGSEMAIKTEIEVGAAPKVRERLEELQNANIKKKSDYAKASKNLIVLSSMREKAQLPEQKEELYKALINVTQQLMTETEKIKSEISILESELQKSAEGRVEAVKWIYPGVRVSIKNARRYIKEPMQQTIFLKEGADVVLSGELASADQEKSKE